MMRARKAKATSKATNTVPSARLQPKPLKYFQGNYPATHWALCAVDANYFIAALEFIFEPSASVREQHRVEIKLNPTDSRGYRALCVLINPAVRHKALNRSFSFYERLAMMQAMNLLAEVYKAFNLIPQLAVSGNNAQALREDGYVQCGNAKEPSFCHGHVLGRGNPALAYIAGRKLRGPVPGALFNLRGGEKGVRGNERKVPWSEGEVGEGKASKVAEAIAKVLCKVIKTYCKEEEVRIVKLHDNKEAESRAAPSPSTALGKKNQRG